VPGLDAGRHPVEPAPVYEILRRIGAHFHVFDVHRRQIVEKMRSLGALDDKLRQIHLGDRLRARYLGKRYGDAQPPVAGPPPAGPYEQITEVLFPRDAVEFFDLRRNLERRTPLELPGIYPDDGAEAEVPAIAHASA